MPAGSLDTLSRTMCNVIEAVSLEHPTWSFSGQDQRGDAHDIAQYPAMMVPQMQGLLMDAAAAALGETPSVIDPFVGSGTTMVEALRRGWAFCGRDINPLAILLCKAKAEDYEHADLDRRVEALKLWLATKPAAPNQVSFAGINKWFRLDVQAALAAIREAILADPSVAVRRLMWCALAETVRRSSNSRTSTFKLHIRPASDPVPTGTEVHKRFLDTLGDIVAKVKSERVRRPETRAPRPDLRVADTRILSVVPTVNLLVTSPPYGDNNTTVPYGQFSYLPLQWIDFDDIEEGLAREAVLNTHALDSCSLGGKKPVPAAESDELCNRIPRLRAFVDELGASTDLEDRRKRHAKRRAVTFIRDLDIALARSCAALSAPAFSLWTVGNRRIAGREFPLSEIMASLLMQHGATLAAQVKRTIPSKRMAIRNSISSTMREEIVLIAVHPQSAPSSGG